jgi:hypothetical protein
MKNSIHDDRIIFWTHLQREYNFGDFLGKFIAKTALSFPIIDADLYHMIGSVIDNDLLVSDLRHLPAEATIAYWGCGCRKPTPLRPDFTHRALICGVRGPLSRDCLGLPADTALGDPALLLPILYEPKQDELTSGRTVCIPHILQDRQAITLLDQAGADVILSTAVGDEAGLLKLVDAIASADFVLSGSLHGAIVAHAYGRPYAFWQGAGIDVPFKWDDFAALVGIEAEFASNVEQGRAIHARRSNPDRISLASILGSAPFAPRVDVMARALLHDAAGTPAAAVEKIMRAARGAASAASAAHEALEPVVRAARKRRDVERSQSSHLARTQVATVLREEAGHLFKQAETLGRRSEAFSLTITPDNPFLEFADGAPTLCLLEGSWSPPGGRQPWSLQPTSMLVLPYGLGWEGARSLTLAGQLFAPRTGPNPRRRHIWIWLNASLAYDETHENQSDTDLTPIKITLPIPRHILATGANLSMEIRCDHVGSLCDLGLSNDTRQVGLALASLQFQFERTDEGIDNSDFGY